MPSSRPFRLITVLLTLACLLFMQLAVAGYACSLTMPNSAEVGVEGVSAMPCAESMVVGSNVHQPQLCHAHCHALQQSLDKHQLPAFVSVTVLPVSFSVPLVISPVAPYGLEQPLLQRITEPPLAIRHCCFRL